MSYADEVAVKAPFDYADEVTVKAESNQLSDKFEVHFEPASINDASPLVVPKNRYRNWPALNQAIGVGESYADIPYTPEEDEAFELLERNQQLSEFARIERNHEIALMANVIRSTVRTHSAEGIATRLFEAGYRFDSSAVCLK
ncbi:hypothetical protein [Shewanella sp. 10B]|uniref:hypothetical protein n=1 Tax=Shewanella sp. 10B TaxID=2943322 RepID=UPI00201AA7F9|nr:hypothetical protein [Shewanella sp. 10B]